MVWEWVNNAFVTLPGCDSDLFQKVVTEKRLRFGGQDLLLDEIDRRNARLICCALYKRASLFLGLPDYLARRSAFLCAISLLQTWLDSRKSHLPIQTVLYFGSTVGIREQLRGVTIRGVNLADAFRQQDLGRQGAKPLSSTKKSTTASSSENLPQIVTIYAPIEPEACIKLYKPAWIAVDCSDVPSLGWLESLLQYATQQHIPVIGWGQNPLSECIAQFGRYGLVFRWPVQIVKNTVKRPDDGGIASSMLPSSTLQIHPLIVSGREIDLLERAFHDAGQSLTKAFQFATERFGKDAIRIYWRYLRALETLAIPFDFYEAEVNEYWGLQSFDQLQRACHSFRDACQLYNKALLPYFEEADKHLEFAKQYLQDNGVPLWQALAYICIEEPPQGDLLTLVFTSRARKQLFLFALLARYSITEEDLVTLNIQAKSLDELRSTVEKQYKLSNKKNDVLFYEEQILRFRPLLIGLPAPSLDPKLLPVLLNDNIDVLIYSYQKNPLVRRVSAWTGAFQPNLSQMMDVLSQLSDLHKPTDEIPYVTQPYFSEPVGIEIKSGQRKLLPRITFFWQPGDPLQEITRLLDANEPYDENDDELTDETIASLANIKVSEAVWCQEGVEIEFDQGWHALFAPDAVVNVVVSGGSSTHIDPRSVKSLKINSRVVVLPGQQRQSIYGLLLSRVHKHPTIQLHLAFIHRWQEDFIHAYQLWRQLDHGNLNELLRQLRQIGSEITSTAALSLWLRGHILCPEDVDDLQRLAEVLAMDFVRLNYHRIYHAAKSLRGLHRKLSRRLNRWLNEEAGGLAAKNSDDVIDANLGLTFEDFRNSLLLLHVKAIRVVSGPFLRNSLGRLEKTENYE